MPEVAIPLAAIAAGATLLGGMIALRLSHALPTVIAFTGGIVVAVALLDLLPEAIENVGDAKDATALVAAGFLLFLFAEQALVLHHRDEPDQARAHDRVGILGATGLSAHSFIDGLGIGLAFGLDTATGVLVFIAVLSHDFADGMNTVSFVLNQSGDRSLAKRWLRVDAAAPLLGAIVGSLITISDHTLGYILSLYAGFFLYMGATDLLPEAHDHDHSTWTKVGLTACGFGFVYVVARIAGV